MTDPKTTDTKSSGCCTNKMCCPNIGKTDRIIRAAIGLGLISLVFVGPQTPLGWIGVIPLATAAMGWCGLYTVLGINTKNCCGPKSDTKAAGTCCGGGGCHSGDKPAA